MFNFLSETKFSHKKVCPVGSLVTFFASHKKFDIILQGNLDNSNV